MSKEKNKEISKKEKDRNTNMSKEKKKLVKKKIYAEMSKEKKGKKLSRGKKEKCANISKDKDQECCTHMENTIKYLGSSLNEVNIGNMYNQLDL